MKRSRLKLRRDAIAIFRAGLKAADAREAVGRSISFNQRTQRLQVQSIVTLELKGFERVFVVGAGKAAASMAVAVEQALGPNRITGGLIQVKYGHARPKPQKVRVIECGHPLPDETGFRGAQEMEALLRELNARDLLLVVLSGGASALLPYPAAPLSLADKQQTTDLLLRAGADIFELNSVRKHLSALKGGQLAALAYPATIVSLILSDVIGDPLDIIASGPTAPDPLTFGDALRVLSKYSLTQAVPRPVLQRLEDGARGRVPETPKPGDAIFEQVHNVVVGSNRIALDGAALKAHQLGYRPIVLSSTMQGETREVARVHAEILREVLKYGSPAAPPACLLSGGETTVTVRGHGKGGRNQEFALAAALQLTGVSGAVVLSGGTDGTDGPTDAAGAIADGTTCARAMVSGFDPAGHLTDNDSYPLFAALGDLLKTGGTGTNVMDMHVMLASD